MRKPTSGLYLSKSFVFALYMLLNVVVVDAMYSLAFAGILVVFKYIVSFELNNNSVLLAPVDATFNDFSSVLFTRLL